MPDKIDERRTTNNEQRLLRWRAKIICLILFLFSFGLYLKTLPPTFYLDDSPETVIAAATLGIPHSPGYPFYTLLSRTFTCLAPGNTAIRLNFLAALLAAAAVALLFLALRCLAIVLDMPRGTADMLAVFCVLLFMQGRTIWAQAGSAKGGYYCLNLLLVSSILYLIMMAERRRRFRAATVFFLLGLFVAHHWMSAVIFGCCLLLYYGVKRYFCGVFPFEFRRTFPWFYWRSVSPKHLLHQAFAFLLGCSLYLYHPLRAVRQPLLNWEDPINWSNFLWTFLRRGYLASEGARSVGVIFRQFGHGIINLAGEYGYCAFIVLAPLFLIGLWRLRRRRALLAYLIMTSFGILLVLAGYLNLSEKRFHLIDVYMLTVYPAWLAGICAGSCQLWQWCRGRRQVVAVCLLLVAGFSLGRLYSEFPQRDRRDCFFAYDYGLNVLNSLPPNSVLFAKGDTAIFPLWYFQYVEGRRMDVAVIGVDGLPMEWVRHNMVRLHPWLSVPQLHQAGRRRGNELIPQFLSGLITLNEGKRLIYTNYNKLGEDFPPGYKPIPAGVVHRLVRAASVEYPAPDLTARWRGYYLRGVFDGRVSRPARPELRMIHDYSIMLNSAGVFYEDLGDQMTPRQTGQRGFYAASLYWFRQALSLSPKDEEFAYNVGNGYYHIGETVRAINYYRHTLALDPTYNLARLNLAVAYYNRGNYRASRREVAAVLRQDPGNEKAQVILRALADRPRH